MVNIFVAKTAEVVRAAGFGTSAQDQILDPLLCISVIPVLAFTNPPEVTLGAAVKDTFPKRNFPGLKQFYVFDICDQIAFPEDCDCIDLSHKKCMLRKNSSNSYTNHKLVLALVV